MDVPRTPIPVQGRNSRRERTGRRRPAKTIRGVSRTLVTSSTGSVYSRRSTCVTILVLVCVVSCVLWNLCKCVVKCICCVHVHKEFNHWLVRNFYCAPQTSCMLKRWYISRDCDQLLSTLVGQFQTCVFFVIFSQFLWPYIFLFLVIIYIINCKQSKKDVRKSKKKL